MSISPLPGIYNQASWPGAGDVDDCAVIATFWAGRASGYTGSLPTIAAFRAAAGRPDAPGPTGLTNTQVWRGVQGTVLGTLHPILRAFQPWDVFAAAMKRGEIASVGLDSSKLPATLRYNFLGQHRVGLAWRDRWMIANPLGPDHSAPLPIDEDALRTAILANGGGFVYAVTFPPQEAPMLAVTNPAPKTVDIAVGKQLFELNGVSKVKTSVAQPDIYSPFASGIYRAVTVTTGGVRQLLLVKAADCTDVRPLVVDVKHPLKLTQGAKVLWEGTI